jgi:iron complex transport system ATP-binding protein
MTLEIIGLQYSYGLKDVIKGIDVTAESKLTALIGPNAAGKSTLLKCIAGILKAHGEILLDGTDISHRGSWNARKNISYLPQEMPHHNTLTVMEFVLLGRLNSLTWKVCDDETALAYDVMTDLGILDIATCPMNTLSGGQQQMVSIAQALVKNPHLLLLDEPTNNLDLQKQLELFELIKGITTKNKIVTLAVLHDINFAARYADEIVVMYNGTVHCSGSPSRVINEKMIREVYGVNATITSTVEGIPQVSPICSVRCLPWLKKNTSSIRCLEPQSTTGEAT